MAGQRRGQRRQAITAGSGLSVAATAAAAATEATDAALAAGSLDRADLLVAFTTPHHLDELAEIQRILEQRGGTECIVGCSAAGVLTEAGEVEQGPVLGVLAIGGLRGVASPWLVAADLPEVGDAAPGGAAAHAADGSTVVLLAGPRPDLGGVVDALSGAGARIVVGAAASGSGMVGRTVEWCGGERVYDGLAGITFGDGLAVRVGVAQGCQPLGEPLLITRGGGNVIREIAFRPAVEVLKEVLEVLPEEERARLRGGVFIGLAADEYKDELGRGDFLVRNIVGMDPDSGAIAVAETVRVGQSIQFQLRDRRAAHEDLSRMLDGLRPDVAATPPRFGLYFNCLGRGARLFGEPSHDVTMIRERLGAFPLLGLFGNAELAPLGGRNRVHNYTGVLALFS